MNNRYNITVAEKYTDNKGEEKTHFTKIGTAFYNKDSDTFFMQACFKYQHHWRICFI